MSTLDSDMYATHIGEKLKDKTLYKLAEIVLLFILVAVFVLLLLPLAGENLLYKQGIVWLANIFMLLYIWAGIRLRGDDCSRTATTIFD